MSLHIGMKSRVETQVTEQNTAIQAGSGTLPVFATPWMCALMENAAWLAIAPGLQEGESTVGTKLNISHSSATPIGLKVWAEAEVTAIDGKRIELSVSAYDEAGLIGSGTHERFIVANERFLSKTAKKLEG